MQNNTSKNINIKQIAFVLVGLVIIAGVFFFSRMQSVEAAKKDGKKFDDWAVVCQPKDPKAKGTRVCYLTQQVKMQVKTKDETSGEDVEKQTLLAFYKFVYVDVVTNPDEQDPKKRKTEKKLRLVHTVPHSVNIPAGVSVVSNNEIIARGGFLHCDAIGCHALQDYNQEALEKLLDSKEKSFVVYLNANSKQVIVPFSTKGLKAGLKYIK